jgi:hypothetical protein
VKRRGLGDLRRGALALCAGVVAGLGACAPDPRHVIATAPTLELERLAFVPAGRTPRAAALDVVGSDVDLLVDRFEVTREHWLAVQRLGQGPWGTAPAGDLPATHVTLPEALEFARRRGMRLPTATEWLWCAVGPRGSAYPYGRPRAAIVNMRTPELGLDLGRPTPVGTFEAGRTPDTGLYDLHGNVRELTWTPGVGDQPAGVHAAGGSFDTPLTPLFGRVPQDFVLLDPISGDARLADVGLRCAVPAEEWLRAHAERLSLPDERARVVAVGARWGGRAAPLLTQLAGATDAPPALAWLLEGAR